MRLADMADPMIPRPIMPTAFDSMALLPICASRIIAKVNSSRMRCHSKKVRANRWLGGAGVFVTHGEQKIAGETPAPQKAKSLKERLNKRERVEFPAMIIYKFVRTIEITPYRIEAHDQTK